MFAPPATFGMLGTLWAGGAAGAAAAAGGALASCARAAAGQAIKTAAAAVVRRRFSCIEVLGVGDPRRPCQRFMKPCARPSIGLAAPATQLRGRSPDSPSEPSEPSAPPIWAPAPTTLIKN